MENNKNNFMKEKELIIDGIKIAYITRMVNTDTPVFVFLHGWGGNMTNFNTIYNHFSDMNILALDFPGFGHSAELADPWKLEQYAMITEKLITKKIDSNQKIILVGHSFGGRVMMQMLANKSTVLKSVQKYIFIGTPFYREELGISKKLIGYSAKVLHTITLLPGVAKLRKPLRRMLYTAIGATDYLELGEDKIMRETFQNTINHDISKYIVDIPKEKTILIWGENDKTVPFSVGQKVATEIQIPLYKVIKAGHMPFADNEKEFMEVFNDILAKL